MEIFNNLFIRGNALFFGKEKVLVLSDLHIGQDESLNSNGFLVPRFQFDDLFLETQRLVKVLKPRVVVLNGDIKHEFSGILREENSRIKEFIDFLRRKCEVVLVKGNHDSILKPLADRLGLEMRDFFVVGDCFICHGDKLFDNDDFRRCSTVIIGHEHPAVSLRSGPRVEKYKCFLVGKYLSKNLVVMPAMNPTSEGSDVLAQRLLSPFLKGNVSFKEFKVFIVDDDKVFDFGFLSGLE